ncbi:MAG: hypothetical protein MMC33_001471 [Icmadophila ericetorum]|nr:hypothetical protein [Icmadophila ericetorum]
MSVSSLDSERGSTTSGPYVLSCEYCYWTSLDIGIEFQRANNIFGQLEKLQHRYTPQTPLRTATSVDDPMDTSQTQGHGSHYNTLKSFYASQLEKTNPSNPLMSLSGDINYNSPSSLARIMSLYTGVGSYGKKSMGKPSVMRESADESEGLRVMNREFDEEQVIKLSKVGWDGTTSIVQNAAQEHPARFIDEIRPVPTVLRTKKSVRCRTCRHILVKPEPKVQSTRYKIKLVANNYVPLMAIKPLHNPSTSSNGRLDLNALEPLRPSQFLLTLTNPMFDPVKVTLATPTQTPGRFSSRVTVLCPQFDVGPNTDAWDEALNTNDPKSRGGKPSKARSEGAESESKVAEAGKIWEKGRNWTTVVVEVVCARIECEEEDLEEDEDVLEIPVFIRIEYEADVAGDEGGSEKEKREKRELAYWCVLGVGRIVKT